MPLLTPDIHPPGSTKAMEPSNKILCAQCGKPATARCTRCAEGADHDGEASPMYYCGTDCQKAHWPTHMADCKLANDRKQVYRAGELMQRLFYACRKECYNINVASVEAREGKLYVKDLPLKGKPFVPFPQTMIVDEADEKAMIAWRAGIWNYDDMLGPIKKAIKGTRSTAVELEVDVFPSRQRIFPESGMYDGIQTTMRHRLVRITLKDGMSYAFDVAGAQFGHTRAVTPWLEYEKSMVAQINKQEPFGTSRRLLEQLEGGAGQPFYVRLVYDHLQIAKKLDETVECWCENVHKTTLAQMLRGPKLEYVKQSVGLLEFAVEPVRQTCRDWETKVEQGMVGMLV